MDTAKLATTADELAHLPSIQDAVNIFIQMLQQLQVCFIVQ